jgi:DNA polymerase III subunit gamma/tau
MSYLVLARKYRPKTFTEMVGQEHVVQALTNALQTQRLHHAYLFTGTRGVGKTTVSRVLAKSLNCQGADGQGGITAEPCGICQACMDIDAGRFVDYTELDAASNRGVDEVQSLLEQAVYKPVQGRFKVFMIDEVHMLTNTAFNAMLKTLEEPPEYLKFVLATTDPQKVPVTVLSRCLQFNLRPMAPETVFEHLSRVLIAEGVASEPGALRLLSRAARGSMRDALSLTDQAIAFGSGQLQEASVRQMLGSADRSHVYRLIESLAQGDARQVIETSDALRLNGINAAATLEEMSVVLQRMAVYQAVPQIEEVQDPDVQEQIRLAQLMAADETQLLYSLCLHGRQELGLAPDEYAALTMVLLRLLAFKPSDSNVNSEAEKKTLNKPDAAPQKNINPPAKLNPVQINSPIERAPVKIVEPAEVQSIPVREVVTFEERPAVNHTQHPPSEPPRWAEIEHDSDAAIVSVPVVEASELSEKLQPLTVVPEVKATPEGDFWYETVHKLVQAEAINALVRELALQSQLIARDSDAWMIRVERESLNNTTSRERLQAALAQHGFSVRLMVEIGRVQDSPAKRNAAAVAARQAQAETSILQDPYVQTLMREYSAKIVPGSIKPI